jgi:microcystin-dependent protein
MGQPFVGECRMVGFNFNPVGWMFCQGQVVPISEYETLFNLIGTTYGGDGVNNFQLPDLRGRAAVHQGPGMPLGQVAGTESVNLTTQQLPTHRHPLQGSSNAGTANNVQNNVLANSPNAVYSDTANPLINMNNNAVSMVGGNLPHENRQPFLTINWIISLFGIFPSQS